MTLLCRSKLLKAQCTSNKAPMLKYNYDCSYGLWPQDKTQTQGLQLLSYAQGHVCLARTSFRLIEHKPVSSNVEFDYAMAYTNINAQNHRKCRKQLLNGTKASTDTYIVFKRCMSIPYPTSHWRLQWHAAIFLLRHHFMDCILYRIEKRHICKIPDINSKVIESCRWFVKSSQEGWKLISSKGGRRSGG